MRVSERLESFSKKARIAGLVVVMFSSWLLSSIEAGLPVILLSCPLVYFLFMAVAAKYFENTLTPEDIEEFNTELKVASHVPAAPTVSQQTVATSPSIGKFEDEPIYDWVDIKMPDGNVLRFNFFCVARPDPDGVIRLPEIDGKRMALVHKIFYASDV